MGEITNSFNEREKAFEAKYLHDEELNFRIMARRNHLFGLWAAGILGYADEKANVYAEEVIVVEIQKTHKDDVLHKVLKDLEIAKVQMSEHQVRKELEKCWAIAREMIINDREL